MPPKRKLPIRQDKKPSAVVNDGPVPPKKTKVSVLVAHPSHQTREGHVLTLGQGDVGQLGLGEVIYERGRPALVPLAGEIKGKVVEAIAGGMHTVCLTSDGEVYTFGCNDEGALGRDTSKEGSEFTPAKVDLPHKIIQISCGDSHTAGLTAEGRVYIWGTFRDANGPFGLTSEGMEKLPYRIPLRKPIIKISSGNDHLCLLTSEGIIYSLGSGEQGQLGRIAQIFAIRGGRKGTSILHVPSPIYCQRKRGEGKVLFDDVWCTPYATFATKKGGGVYAWGLNNYHQLGLDATKLHFMPEPVETLGDLDVKEIRGGQHHTIVLDAQGKVYALGRTDYGRLGLGDDCVESDEPSRLKTLDKEKVVTIGCGSSMSICTTKTGGVYSWGMGSNLQLGTGEEDDELTPVKIVTKQLENRKALTASAGGQHTVILACD